MTFVCLSPQLFFKTPCSVIVLKKAVKFPTNLYLLAILAPVA